MIFYNMYFILKHVNRFIITISSENLLILATKIEQQRIIPNIVNLIYLALIIKLIKVIIMNTLKSFILRNAVYSNHLRV